MTGSGTKAQLPCAVLVAALGLFTAIAQGQSGQAGGSSRQIVHEVGLSPIDVGLRDKEMPRDARTRATPGACIAIEPMRTCPTCAAR